MILQARTRYKEGEEKANRKRDGKISEWTGLGLGEALQMAEDRQEWRQVVARSSLMSRRSFSLQDE